MDERDMAVTQELNIGYGTGQVVKATPDMKTIPLNKHMDKNKPKQRQQYGAWEWILRILGEMKASMGAPSRARMKVAARTGETLKEFLAEGLIHRNIMVGLLDLLGNFMERKSKVTVAE